MSKTFIPNNYEPKLDLFQTQMAIEIIKSKNESLKNENEQGIKLKVKEIDRLNQELKEKKSSADDLKEKLDIKNTLLAELEKKLKENSEILEKLELELNYKKKSLNELNEKINTLAKEKEELAKDNNKMNEESRISQHKLFEVQAKLIDTQIEIAKLKKQQIGPISKKR